MAGLRVLAVDDVPPALDELCQLLRESPEVAEVVPAATLARVLRLTRANTRRRVEPVDAMAALPVETAGRTYYVRRSEVQFVEAHGDYVRLHTPSGTHTVRIGISRLEEYWERAGFVRVHRGFLLDMKAVRELRSDSTGGLDAPPPPRHVPGGRRGAQEIKDRML